MSALATVAGKNFNNKFTAKIDFPIGYFYVTIANADIGSLKSLHTLFVFGPHAGEIWTKSRGLIYKILSFLTKKKWLTIFDKVLTPFWKSFCDWNHCLMLN